MESLVNIHISEEMVLNVLKNLNPNKSQGPYGIHPYVLHETAEQVAQPITIIYRKSVQERTVP